MQPRIISLGHGYACRFAAETLRRAGFPVTDGGDPADADICLTDDLATIADQVGGDEPWPSDLRSLTLVELAWPAALPDANARIAELSGIGAVIGEADGPGIAPPGRMLEALAGLQAATAALAGWLAARRDGLGEHVVVDPVACLAGMSGVNAIQFLNYGRPWRRSGPSASGSGGPYPFRVFRCADGWIAVICRARIEWDAFLALLGDPPWAKRPEFADQIVIAAEHADEVSALITDILSTRTVDDVVAAGREFRVPIAPLRTAAEALADPQLLDGTDPVPAVTVERPRPTKTGWRPDPGGPLAGLRVLDLGWVWAAPVASAWLADLGADVVKVESLDRLDVGRRRGLDFPAGLPSARATLPGYERAWLYNAANRNKRGIRLELKDPADHARFLELVASADVVVESFATGVLERLDLAPERLFEANPALVLLSMGGRTIDGDYLARSYAPMLTALAGLEAAVTSSSGEPLGLLNWGVADPNAGAWATFAVVSALAADAGGSHLLLSQLRALVNTCVSHYRGEDPPQALLPDPPEVTLPHLQGTAPGPLGDLYRSVMVRGWSPEFGERMAFGSPWRFRRSPVGVRTPAPLFASTDPDEVLASWRGGVHANRDVPSPR
ncbi:CoA transferase [Actinophytocola oryzae]|uniref:CoA transferase family III n=1 Tax=Actinophytocola oryzae TaxID=502181 RepID=A0A4R7W1B0_9PSEU|nr:CoA transferase [Actinophytocola oryzae]TDV56340.1 CoA transferase family III [Actinophytocola oryzae]